MPIMFSEVLIIAWAYALFSAFIISFSMLGFGFAFHRAFKKASHGISLPIIAAVGAGLFCTASFTVGIAGGYNSSLQTAVVLAGLCFLFWGRDFWKMTSGFKLPRLNGWYILPLVYLVTRFFTAGLPQQHSDPLYYHLAAPKFWAEHGKILLTESHPSFAQAALWETVYGIPQLWFGVHGAFNHVVAQVFSQWMHFFWGQFLTIVLAAKILQKFAPSFFEKKGHGVSFFFAWLCCTLPSIEWLGCLAKNDYLITTFIFAAVIECIESRFIVAGVFLGFAYSTKVLSVWSILAIPFFIYFDSGRKKASKAFAQIVVVIAIVVLPLFIRNLIWTKNPFFPMFDDRLGPHWISTLWNNHNASFGGALRWDLLPSMFGWFWFKLFEGALPKILFCTGTVAFFYECFHKKTVKAGAWISFLSIQTFFAFLMLRYPADGRYGNFFGILWLLFFLASLFRMVALSRFKNAFYKWGWVAFIPLGLLINSPIDAIPKTIKNFWFSPATKYVELFHFEHPLHQWVHDHVKSDEQILFAAQKINFYLDRQYDSVVEMKKWEEFFTNAHSAKDLFKAVYARGYRYLHISPQTGGYPPWLKPYWEDLLSYRKQAVFETWDSLVFDLSTIVLN